MGKKVKEITNDLVDNQTGEIVKSLSSVTYVDYKSKEPFFLTYSRHMSILYELTKASTIWVLWKFLEYSEYNTNEVNITPKRKQDIIKSLGISLPTYNTAIKDLKTHGLIYGERGTYTLNEEIHWRGTYEEREKILKSRLKITIEPEYTAIDPDGSFDV